MIVGQSGEFSKGGEEGAGLADRGCGDVAAVGATIGIVPRKDFCARLSTG
jgi:hypothetical protein